MIFHLISGSDLLDHFRGKDFFQKVLTTLKSFKLKQYNVIIHVLFKIENKYDFLIDDDIAKNLDRWFAQEFAIHSNLCLHYCL